MADEEDEQLETPPADSQSWPGAEPKQAAFLTALVFFAGQHGKAARAAKISRHTPYDWLQTDENYQLLHAKAMARATQVLADAALRRCVEGVPRGVYFQGDRIATERVYSDGMTMFLLRAADREKYGDRTEVKGKVDVTHKFEGTMEELLMTYRKLTSEGPKE